MRPRKKAIRASELRLIASADEFSDVREPPLRMGDMVRLNSGGPLSLVVDIDGDAITAAWRGGELSLPRACFYRERGLF